MNGRINAGLKTSLWTISFIVFLVCLTSLPGCSKANSGGTSSSDSHADVLQSKEAVMHVSALSKECTFESLRDDSDFIASGRYIGKSNPFLVIPVVGGIDAAMYYTDYYFEVEDIFKGDVRADETSSEGNAVVAVRMKGGVGDRIAIVNDDVPELQEDNEYLLFLYRVLDGLDGNTEGNHYYSFGDKLGIWEKDGSAFSNTEIGNVDASSLGVMPMSDAIPASEQNLRSEDAMIEDVRNLYAAGEIDKRTLDAYEELYDASRNNYATIGGNDEVRTFEAKVVQSASASQSS